MILSKKLNVGILLLYLYLIGACAPDAPHDNPLDPQNNPQYNRINGKVYSYYSPHTPLENVSVMLEPGEQRYTTNNDGSFIFSKLQPDRYTVSASKSSYQSEAHEVVFQEYNGLKSVDFYMNALPVITAAELYSEHIDQWWPGEIFRLQISAVIEDRDGASDIDTVACIIPGLPFSKYFRSSDRPDSFYVTIDDFELPGGSLYSICAESCYVRIVDKTGADITHGPYFLYRIIEDAPVPQSPTDQQIVTGKPLFVWQSIVLPYHFTQEIHLYRLFPGGLTLIETIEKMASDVSHYLYQQELQSGSYIWTVAVRDECNNFSRSKEASFIIE
jgi:hypothetical protein